MYIVDAECYLIQFGKKFVGIDKINSIIFAPFFIKIFNMKINSEHVYKQIKEKLEKEGATMSSYDKETKVLKFTNVIN